MKTIRTSELLTIMIGASLASLVACGGSTLRLRGAQFDLNGQEATLAAEYTRRDPVEAPPEARCQYWASRSMDAMRPHAMGVLIWPPERFLMLRQWAEGKQMEVCRGHIKHEQQPDGTEVTAHISNGTVVAAFAVKAHCRDTRVDDLGHPFSQQSPWIPCAGGPLAATSVRLLFADGQTVTDTTDTKGLVAFDLSEVRWTDDALKTGQAQLLSAGNPNVAFVSFAILPQYAEWQKTKELERTSAEAEQLHVAYANNLIAVEQHIQGLNQPWTDFKLDTLNQAFSTYTSIDTTHLEDAEQQTYRTVGARLDVLVASAKRAVTDAQATALRRRKGECTAKFRAWLATVGAVTAAEKPVRSAVCFQTCLGRGVDSDVCDERCNTTGVLTEAKRRSKAAMIDAFGGPVEFGTAAITTFIGLGQVPNPLEICEQGRQ